jgi:AraC family transcriptional regulator of adaptative response / methylphosphotriester-DNA alkyltransferase methyltransferase
MPTQRPTTVRHRTSLFEDAVAIVESDFASDLSLDDIARRVASSRRQLQRAYAEIGDTTFRDHLTAVRMNRAADLLRTRGLTVREVAYRVGYRQPAQFAKAFRRHHGSSPSDFRAARRLDGMSSNGNGNGAEPAAARGVEGFAQRRFAAA